jgi:hypothetical protein
MKSFILYEKGQPMWDAFFCQSFSGMPRASTQMEPVRIIIPSTNPQMPETTAPNPQVQIVIRSWATALPV